MEHASRTSSFGGSSGSFGGNWRQRQCLAAVLAAAVVPAAAARAFRSRTAAVVLAAVVVPVAAVAV
jgi:hypothetical protein